MLANRQSSHQAAIAALFLLALIWGYNWVQWKVAMHYASPFTFSAVRIVLGAISLFLGMLWLRKPLLPKEIPGTFWSGALQIGGVYGLASWALVSGGAGKTSVLVYTMPIWTIMLAWFFLNERIRGMQWFAIGLSIVGLLFIIDPLHLGGTAVSKVLALVAGLSWAAGAVIAKKLRQQVSLDLLSFTAWQMVAGAVILAPVALVEPNKTIVWSTPFMIALLYNVIPGTAIATLLWLFVLNRLPAGMAGLGVLLNPVVGVIAAHLQLGETPGAVEAIGMGLIAVALIINAIQATRLAPQLTQ